LRVIKGVIHFNLGKITDCEVIGDAAVDRKLWRKPKNFNQTSFYRISRSLDDERQVLKGKIR
jgi:hypothetical protein